MKRYRPRFADDLLKEKLAAHGAVAIRGTRGSGKSSSFRRFSRSVVALEGGDGSGHALELARLKPSALLSGPVPRLIDEWQLAPTLRDAIRDALEERPENGRFLLTSSVTPPDLSVGSNRVATMTMRPMTLAESGDSTGSVSLRSLFNGGGVEGGYSRLDIDQLAYLICRGGWPATIGCSRRAALRVSADYVQGCIPSDICRVDQVARHSGRCLGLLRAYARHLAEPAKLSTIVQELTELAEHPMSDDTAAAYLHALRRLFVVEELPAWHPALRSRAVIRKADARYFTDPSIGTAALGIAPRNLLADLGCMERHFKNLCMRDLRVYAEALRGELFHYRDKNGLSCDAVICLTDGTFALVQICLGGEEKLRQAAASLHKLEKILDSRPAFSMTLTGVDSLSYRREDGVLVVPIGALTR